MIQCPRCRGKYPAMHVVVLDEKTSEVVCWRCVADELVTNCKAKWMGSI